MAAAKKPAKAKPKAKAKARPKPKPDDRPILEQLAEPRDGQKWSMDEVVQILCRELILLRGELDLVRRSITATDLSAEAGINASLDGTDRDQA